MKITTANQLAPSFSLLLVITLLLTIGLLGCSDRPEVADVQNEEKATAEPSQFDKLMTESDLIAGSPAEGPLEPITEEMDESAQEAIASLDQAADTLLSDATEAESPLSEIMTDTESSAVALEDEPQIEDKVDLSEIVKSTPDLVRKVQQALAGAGFNPGAIDGINGPRTMSALKNFQKQHNLAVGQLTKETLQMLGVPY